MANNSTPSLHSPKNAYRASIYYTPALDFGSVESYGAMDIDTLKALVSCMVTQRRSEHRDRELSVRVEIMHNEAEWPVFNWAKVEDYEL